MFCAMLTAGISLQEVGRLLEQYIPFVILFVVAAAFGGGVLALSHLLGPGKPNPDKMEPYESGMVPIGGTRGRFSIKFYLVALLFILFDIEIIFLYPWAVIFLANTAARVFLFAEMLAFLVVLGIGYVYIWRKGALDWD